jgi:acyl-CoA thioester hydrolase
MSPSDEADVFAETGRFVVHPWHCDANGHLNTRYFQGFFDDATQHLLALCGHECMGVGGRSVVDVRCTMNYKAEVPPGALVVVRSGFSALGGKSFTSAHEMRSVNGAILFATCETVSVFFDLAARLSVAMSDDFRAKAGRLMGPATAPIP